MFLILLLRTTCEGGAGFAEATARQLLLSKTEGPRCGCGGILIMRDCAEHGKSAGGTGEPKWERYCRVAIKKALCGCTGWACVLKTGFLMCLVDITQRAVCPWHTGGPQGCVAWGPGQPDLVGSSPAHSRDLELDDL